MAIFKYITPQISKDVLSVDQLIRTAHNKSHGEKVIMHDENEWGSYINSYTSAFLQSQFSSSWFPGISRCYRREHEVLIYVIASFHCISVTFNLVYWLVLGNVELN